MSSLIHEIENNEALLLLYLANELTAEDRIEVEQLLSSDGGLRMELEEIRSALAESMAVVSQLDAIEPVSASADASAIRRVGRAIKQWQVDRLIAAPEVAAKTALRYPRWVYPTTAVASLLVGALVWWGMSGIAPNDTTQLADTETPDQKVYRLERSFSDPAALTDAEMQASSLADGTQDPTASVYLSEPAQ